LAVQATPPRLPHGVRDHLPVEAARRGGLRRALGVVLDRAGFREVETPLYELDELFARGVTAEGPLAALSMGAPPAVRFSDPRPAGHNGQVVSLRVDFTPQIARLWATRLADRAGPHRLRYEGSIVRLGEALAGTPSELYQVGVELIDQSAPAGDRELLGLLDRALRAVGLRRFLIDLGHAGFVRRALAPVLATLNDPRPLLEALRHADARGVGHAIASVADRRARLLVSALPSLRGDAAVLVEAARLCRGDRVAQGALTELGKCIDALPGTTEVTLDLGEVRGLGYYTGTRFSAYAHPSRSGAVGRAIAVGGRYDELLARFGRPAPAAGFAIELDALDLLAGAPTRADATRDDRPKGRSTRARKNG
jgi:ATP phosphoribosyltransferase regulatory subunit